MPTLTHNGSFRPSSALGEDAVIQRLTECRAEFMRYFQRRLSRTEEAEDAFQDFCVKVLRAAREPQDNGKVDAWLRRVLRNSLIDHYRRRAARQRGRDAYEAEPREMADTPETDYDENPCTCVQDALPALRSDYAEIIRRVDLEEEPRETIAADLGLTSNNIGVRLHRARRAMKDQIEKRCSTCHFRSSGDCDCSPVTHGAQRNSEHDGLKGAAIAASFF